jgi:hypothetical protein
MPSISLTDRLGLNFQVEANTFSAIEKYFKIIPQLILREKTVDELRQLSLADPAITSLHVGLDVNQPIPVGTSAVDFAINGGPSGSLDIFVPSSELQPGEAGLLFSADDFGEDVPVQQNERYVSIGLTATLDASIAMGVSDLSFGFDASTSLSIVNYQKFTLTPTGPSVLDAIGATISKFQLPGDIEDLQSMAPDSIIILSGSGGLQFSATASLAVVSNPLATVELGSVLPSIQIARGNSITVGAAFKQSGDFEIRIRKTGPHTVRLGYFKRHTSEVDLSASAQAGVSVGIGSEDLFGRVISAISPNAVADFKELQAAKVDELTISVIQATVKASIDRSLEIALSAEWDNLRSKEAAFLYEVDLTALDDSGRRAIHKALDGNLSDLIQNEDNLPPGIKMIRSIFTNLRQSKHALRINLLGIYNFISVSKLTLKGTVLFDPASGELTISDSAAATKFQTGALNVGGKPNRADPKQLRKALARYFLITASYRVPNASYRRPN